MAKQYKIRKKDDPNLFRRAGVYDSWDKKGKMYDTLGKLRAVITSTMKYRPHMLNDWEIVEYEVSEVAVKEVNDVIDPKKLVELLKHEYN